MRHLVRFALTIGAATLFAGCGPSQPPTGSPGAASPSGNSTQRSSAQRARRDRTTGHYLYVTNARSGNVSAFAINASSGDLTQVPGSPFATRKRPRGLAIDPTGRFLYVVSGTRKGYVSAYVIDATTGHLTHVHGQPFRAGREPNNIAIDAGGRFAYVTNSCSGYGSCDHGTVSAYTVNSHTGALAQVQGSPFASGTLPRGIAVDPTGKFVYVANSYLPYGTEGGLSAYTINASSGALTFIDQYQPPNGPEQVAIYGSFVYVTNFYANNVFAFFINSASGALTQVYGSPFAAGSAPIGVAITPSGKFLYVGNNESVNISAYRVNKNTGALSQVHGSPFATGCCPNGVAIDPTGQFAYVANAYDNEISAYAINPSNGALTRVQGSPFSAGHSPSFLAIR